MNYLATLAVALLLLDCSGMPTSNDPDGGSKDVDACVSPTLQYPECAGDVSDVPDTPIEITGQVPTGSVDALWSPAEAGTLRLAFDGGAPVAIGVPVDPTPLNDVLADGETVRVTRESVPVGTSMQDSLRIARADGSLVFAVATTTVTGVAAELPSIDGFGAALTGTPACESIVTYAMNCGPAIHRVFSLDVASGDGSVSIAPGQSTEITDGGATYSVTNVRISQRLHPEGCIVCGVAFSAVAQVGVVRLPSP